MEEFDKPIKVKPTFYAYCFYSLKEIALDYGYNLVLHGSLDRDMDLIAIPWQDKVKNSDKMIESFAKYLDGVIQLQGTEQKLYGKMPQGRKSYIIDLRRSTSTKWKNWVDAEYYIDISVTPTPKIWYGKLLSKLWRIKKGEMSVWDCIKEVEKKQQ